ncbi:MAG: hypothetical protein K1X74_16400 [Pirellulales bacterium]|nr:hypothetical protein [Pirellulales bacterium]
MIEEQQHVADIEEQEFRASHREFSWFVGRNTAAAGCRGLSAGRIVGPGRIEQADSAALPHDRAGSLIGAAILRDPRRRERIAAAWGGSVLVFEKEKETMTVLHTGSTKAFAAGWEDIFGKSGGKSSSSGTAKKTAQQPSGKKKSASKSPAKKSPAPKKAVAKASTKKKTKGKKK